MCRYEKRLIKKANRGMNDYDLSNVEYKIIIDFIEGAYNKNKKGYINYLKYKYFTDCSMTMYEYNNLCSLA